MVECELDKSNEFSIFEIEIVVPLERILNKAVERLCDAVAVEWTSLQNLELLVTSSFDSLELDVQFVQDIATILSLFK